MTPQRSTTDLPDKQDVCRAARRFQHLTTSLIAVALRFPLLLLLPIDPRFVPPPGRLPPVRPWWHLARRRAQWPLLWRIRLIIYPPPPSIHHPRWASASASALPPVRVCPSVQNCDESVQTQPHGVHENFVVNLSPTKLLE